jgi:hypothetical protein
MIPADLSILTQGLRPQLPETRKHVTLYQIKHPRGNRLRSQNYAESRAPRYFKVAGGSPSAPCCIYRVGARRSPATNVSNEATDACYSQCLR